MKCRLYPNLYHTFIYVIPSGFSSAVLFFFCNYWLLSISPLYFWRSLGLRDCQCKLKSPVLVAACIKWRELLRALISQAWARLREKVPECIVLFQDQADLSSKRRTQNSPFFYPSNAHDPTWSRTYSHHPLEFLTYSLDLSGHWSQQPSVS